MEAMRQGGRRRGTLRGPEGKEGHEEQGARLGRKGVGLAAKIGRLSPVCDSVRDGREIRTCGESSDVLGCLNLGTWCSEVVLRASLGTGSVATRPVLAASCRPLAALSIRFPNVIVGCGEETRR